jgi:hypothetical protein
LFIHRQHIVFVSRPRTINEEGRKEVKQMKKIVLAAALALVPALATSKAVAQTKGEYGTEVCVNASNVEDAKRLFPNARLHIVPDVPGANGYRIVNGNIGSDGRIHTDAEELKLRMRDRNFRVPGE